MSYTTLYCQKDRVGISIFYNPTLAKSSLKDLDIKSDFVVSSIDKDKLTLPIISYNYGFGLYYKFRESSVFHIKYSTKLLGQKSKILFFDTDKNQGYVLKTKNYTNELSLSYDKLFKRKLLSYYVNCGLIINYDHEFNATILGWDKENGTSPIGSFFLTRVGGENSLVRVGFQLGAGIKIKIIYCLNFQTGFCYNYLGDNINIQYNKNSPTGTAQVLEWNNMLMFSLF